MRAAAADVQDRHALLIVATAPAAAIRRHNQCRLRLCRLRYSVIRRFWPSLAMWLLCTGDTDVGKLHNSGRAASHSDADDPQDGCTTLLCPPPLIAGAVPAAFSSCWQIIQVCNAARCRTTLLERSGGARGRAAGCSRELPEGRCCVGLGWGQAQERLAGRSLACCIVEVELASRAGATQRCAACALAGRSLMGFKPTVAQDKVLYY